MTITVGVDTYVTLAEADTYFLTRYGSDSWDALTDPDKESALVSATKLLDSFCSWQGEKSDPEQALAFPRTPGYDPVPQSIKDAECELAISVVDSGSPVEEISQILTELRAGDVGLKWNPTSRSTSSLYNSYTNSMLTPFCDPTLSTGAGTARVRRT